MSTPLSEYNEILKFKPTKKVTGIEKSVIPISREAELKKENPLIVSLGMQMIFVLVIVIALLCLNTFLEIEYINVERFLKSELAVDVNWSELFDMAKTYLRL